MLSFAMLLIFECSIKLSVILIGMEGLTIYGGSTLWRSGRVFRNCDRSHPSFCWQAGSIWYQRSDYSFCSILKRIFNKNVILLTDINFLTPEVFFVELLQSIFSSILVVELAEGKVALSHSIKG